ncbi:hypothetical protein [Aeribacillus pallidus]|uniref:hypothetical protein n=1 Tax=Aeribacillus pallidus TaxID=33936 RepID=UPI001379B683|nr:hypothetical protein [Aeribacillus pallidus]
MWREIALSKLKSGSGTLKFKTQREINEDRDKKLEQFQESWDKLQELNIRFHEVANVRR